MTEFKAPYETPDAVISAGLHYYHRLDGGRLFRARVWLAKLLRRPVPMQQFTLRIIYKNWQERVEVVTLNAGMIGDAVQRLMDAPLVRQVWVSGPLMFKGRKSFGEDYDPSKMDDFLKAAMESLKKDKPA